MHRPYFLLTGITALLSLAACRPDAPTTEQAPAITPKPAASTAPDIATPAPPTSTDTLHLPGNQVVALRPSSAAAFEHLAAAETLPQELDAETPEATWLAQAQGRVRRQDLDLLLTPARGPVVRLHSTPETEFKNDSASARYQYWGSLPAAHQWVVQAWYWESDGIVLVDQRTGAKLEVAGYPAASPDGRYVLTTSPGLGGGDQVNSLSLIRIDATGPHVLWQREPEAWAPERARWANPNRIILQRSRPDANGELPDPPRPEYVELTLPTTP